MAKLQTDDFPEGGTSYRPVYDVCAAPRYTHLPWSGQKPTHW